jgi:hypothetical protein
MVFLSGDLTLVLRARSGDRRDPSIQQYKTRKSEQINEEISTRVAEGAQASSFCLFFRDVIRALLDFFGVQKWVFGC